MEPRTFLERSRESLAEPDLAARDSAWQSLRWIVDHLPPASRQPWLDEMARAHKNPGQALEGCEALLHLFSGHLCCSLYQHQAALKHFDQAAALARENQNPALAAHQEQRALLAGVLSLSELGRNREALARAEKLAGAGSGPQGPLLAAELNYGKAIVLRRLGQSREAQALLRQAMQDFQAAGDRPLMARAEDAAGLVCLDLGQWDQAELLFHRSLARKTRLGDQVGLALTLGNLGRFYALQEKNDMARSYLQRELELCEELGSYKAAMVARRGLARLAMAAGDWPQADEHLRQVEAMADQVESQLSRAYAVMTRADYHLGRGKWPEARQCHDQARELFGPDPGAFVESQLTLQTGRVKAGLGEEDQAGDCFARACAGFEEQSRPVFLARAEFIWGMWLVGLDRLDEAAGLMEKAIMHAGDIQADGMVERFSAACQQVDSRHWMKSMRKLKEYSNQLAEEKARFELLAEQIIHDLKNKVLAVRWGLDKVAKRSREHKDFSRHLSLVQSTAAYTSEQLMSYLVGYKLEGSQAILDKKPILVAEILGELPQAFLLALEEKGLSLDLAPGPEGLMVEVNEHTFRLPLFNLIDNAIKYTPRGSGSIVVRAIPRGAMVRFEVIDQGNGVPQDMQARIFEKWGRVKGKEANYSTGLGLYHTRMMVRAMGGEIGLESEVGKGSTFWFTAPAAP